MTPDERQQRLDSEREALRALKKSSPLFDFEANGDPPDRYTVRFRGRGICRQGSASAGFEYVELHEVDLRLPYGFPDRPPDVRWLTPIFHPNISFSGFISLRDIGLPWEPDVGLEVICERLWDLARLAYVNLEKATNFSARDWFEDDCPIELPVDPRPLRDTAAPTGQNIIHYQRRGTGRRVTLPEPTGPADILFIGEDTPTPQIPVRVVSPPRRRPDDDDVLYIGDD